MDDSIKSSRFCLVMNIPALYRSCHLRDYFHHLVEREAFCCFHYKHRRQKLSVKHEDDNHKIDDKKRPYLETCFVAIIAIKPKWFCTLIDRFNGRFWTREGDDLPVKCFIRPLAVHNDLNDSQLLSYCSQAGSFLFKRRSYSKTILKDNHGRGGFSGNIEAQTSGIYLSKLLTLQEFNPPSMMPAGNVGTPTKFFLEKISACQLPHRIIKQLQLRFPRGTIRRLYSEVAFDYDYSKKSRCVETSGELIRTGRGQIISEYFAQLEPELEEDIDEEKLTNQEEHNDDDDFTEEPDELDRGLKEPRYEEDIEVTWEKGGSGLVFHTDARFWRELQTSGNDFDALTADDLDIEHRVEFQDKDNQELTQICEERHLRGECNNLHMVNCSSGASTSSNTSTSTKSFDNRKFKKKLKSNLMVHETFGQRILEKFGWSQGQGLGSNNEGIAEPIEDSGKHPKDRRGFGYYGLN